MKWNIFRKKTKEDEKEDFNIVLKRMSDSLGHLSEFLDERVYDTQALKLQDYIMENQDIDTRNEYKTLFFANLVMNMDCEISYIVNKSLETMMPKINKEKKDYHLESKKYIGNQFEDNPRDWFKFLVEYANCNSIKDKTDRMNFAYENFLEKYKK